APHVVVLDRPTLRRHGPVGRKLGLHARPACGTILFPGQRLPPRVFRETETRDIASLLHPENRCQRHRRARLPAAHSRPAPRTAARGPPLPAAFFGRRNAVRPGRLRRGRQLIQSLVHFAKQPLELRPFAIRLQQAEKLGAHFRFSRRPYRRGFHGTDLRGGPSADFVLLPTRFYTVRRNPAFSGAVSRAGPPGARRRVSLRSPTRMASSVTTCSGWTLPRLTLGPRRSRSSRCWDGSGASQMTSSGAGSPRSSSSQNAAR